MAAKKPVSKKATTSRVSPSKRGESAKPKPSNSIVSPSARGEGKTNRKGFMAAQKNKAEVKEAGFGAIVPIVRGAASLAKMVSGRGGSQLERAQRAAKKTPTAKAKQKETMAKIKAGEKATKAAQKSSARSQAAANRAKAAENRKVAEDKKYQAQKEKRFQKGKEMPGERVARLKEQSARRDRISRAEDARIREANKRDMDRYMEARRKGGLK